MEFSYRNIQGARLLIVDDEPVLSLTFAIVLRRAGATVFTAANGQEALHLLEREQVDAMLCDQRMPIMDGPTLLRTLFDLHKSLPTLLFVNGIDGEDMQALERMNVRKLVTKPLQPATLLESFDAVLAKLRD